LGVSETSSAVAEESLETIVDFEKLKDCFECGICTASCPVHELLNGYYNPRVLLERLFLERSGILHEEELWLCAWCYGCYKRCPQRLRPPEIFHESKNLAIKQGITQPLKKALAKIFNEISLPLITLYLCFHPERAGIDRQLLESLIKEAYEGVLNEIAKTEEHLDKKVAVIGAGPAGLSLAYELARKGYPVTVFEAFPEPGGVLRKCIPEFRLPREVLDMEIQRLQNLDVEIRTNIRIGEEYIFQRIWDEGYRAIFIAAGAHKCRELRVEGAELNGVVHALEFLSKANSEEPFRVGEKVVVIGGGNVAVDAARTALRQGGKEVAVLYRRSRYEMPAIPWEVSEAEGEGVKIEFQVAPLRFLGEDGKLRAVECVRTELGEPDKSGRRKPIPIEGSEFIKEADTAILAIGESPDVSFLPKEVELNVDGTVWVNPLTMETTMKGVFAGGDVVTGPATVIEAILAGKRAANSIVEYLERR
jgi:NADPH-dependent glutamate synthase beta subunit-like oxidoreductase